MLRITYQLPSEHEIIPLITSIFKEELCLINPLDSFTYDIYFMKINSIVDVDKIKPLRRNNTDALFILIGPDKKEIIKYGYTLEPYAYLSSSNEYKQALQDILNISKERFKSYDVKYNGRISSLRIQNIQYVESFRHHLELYTINGTFTQRKKLSSFLQEIASESFLQIHKSIVINIKNIKNYNTTSIIMQNGVELPIGKVFKEKVLLKLQSL
ncbi:MAG: LytR/AlgR family response regulator transcription factor [Coprobacillaceae bacterium]